MQYLRALAVVAGPLSLAGVACSSTSKGSAITANARPTSVASGGNSSSGASGPVTVSSGGTSGPNIIVQDAPPDAGMAATPPATDVTVIITADNAYGFGYGTDLTVVNYFGGIENATSAEIFSCPIGVGAETYTVPAAQANAGGYLYVVGYADRSTTQGVLGKFFRVGAVPVYTGTGTWQGCATGMDFDPGSGGPTLDIINQQIALCNAGTTDPLTTSAGWVTTVPSARGNVAFGEDNITPRGGQPVLGNEFNVACGIDAGARWMWYDWEAARTMGSPFIWPGGVGNPIKDFVIFRLAAESIPEPVPK